MGGRRGGAEYGLGAVVEVVGEADAGNIGLVSDLDLNEEVREEVFVVDGVGLFGVVEDALEVGQDGVGVMKGRGDVYET